MFTRKCLTFFYAVTPVHMGAGQALGVIDNPIQRERHTEHPSFAGSGIKGAFRHAAGEIWTNDAGLRDRIFGPEQDASEHAGAVSFSDAQLVAFPVRSLKGVYVYATSPLALQRLGRLAAVAGVAGFPTFHPPVLRDEEAVVLDDSILAQSESGHRLVLESYAFQPLTDAEVIERLKKVAEWLSENALPAGEAHSFFRQKLASHLVLLSDTQLTFFARNATVVEPHVRINDESGTADEGGLFFTENLPPEAVMVGLTMASQERLKKGTRRDGRMSSDDVIRKIRDAFDGRCIQIGGDATTGRGQVLISLRVSEEGENR